MVRKHQIYIRTRCGDADHVWFPGLALVAQEEADWLVPTFADLIQVVEEEPDLSSNVDAVIDGGLL